MARIKTWTGKSRGRGASFAKAAEAAALKAEQDLKDQGRWDPPVPLRVVDMYVTVTNPIHEYIVVLGPGA